MTAVRKIGFTDLRTMSCCLGVILALVMASCAWSQAASTEFIGSEAGVSQRISLNLQSATLGNVLKVMTQKSGINFLIGSELVGKPVNVYLENVLVEDALAAILRANGLWYTRQKGTNIYVIMAFPQGPPVATVTEVIRMSYANASNLAPTLGAVLTEAGRIVVDERTNSLVVSDIPEILPILTSLAKDLDEPTGQVLIEAKIVELSYDASTELGIAWDVDGFIEGDGSSGSTSFGTSFNSTTVGEGMLDLTVGKFASFTDLRNLAATLSAMEKEGRAEVLANPKVLTLDNQEAQIEISQRMALAKKVTYREGGIESTVEPIFGDVGVALKVTPHINNDEFVTMSIEPNVSSAQRSTYFPDEAVDTKRRTAKTTVMVKNGQMVVIGGLLRKDLSETDFKVPLLGDIPFVGELFRKNVDTEQKTEIMLFLRPRIVSAETLRKMSEKIEQRLGEEMRGD